MKMVLGSIKKIAFPTHSRQVYKNFVIPFGLGIIGNALSTFLQLMEMVLRGYICTVYLDDIIVMGTNFEEHLCNLQ